MKKKAKAFTDSGIMPVSGNEEPGVVARQSSNSWSVLPIKKRYSMLNGRAPLHPDRSFSNENESKTKDSGLNSCDSIGKSDTPNNSLLEVKEERPLGAKVDSQPIMLSFLSIYPEANPNTSSSPSRNVDDLVKPALAEKFAGREAIGTTKVSVKKEVVAKQGESHSKLELPADSGDMELSLGPKKPHVSSLVDPNTKESFLMRGTVNPLLLSQEGSCKNADDTLRGFDSSVLQSLAKVDSSRVSPNSSLLENLALNRNLNSPTCKTVKSELVVETLVQANAGTAARPGRTLEANVVKTGSVRQNLQSIELLAKGPPEILEQKPMNCEPLQEVSLEISMISDVIATQTVGRILQLQESSSSSSTLPMPLTPQQGCTSRLSTCSDLSVSGGDLSTPSEYSDHTNEANRSKNALDQANADIAAKNANFDLKELNVSSDKVEASVSAGMNIEDHMVYKKTQDPHNLVASGEGSANDEDKISAGTEEECYGSDYESDGHHAFAGHVDSESVGCVIEDEEYEDGEVREPMMQSIAEDPIAEGMDSEKNNEYSSKNAQSSSGFSGVGESHCFTNVEKGYSMPVHTESNDDFVKSCDDKADKIDHKDINIQSPLLDKEETTGDDEQRLIGAIYQGSVDRSGIADVQEGCEKDVLCVGPSAGSRGAGRNVGGANNEYIGRSDMSPTALSSLQNAETPVNATYSKDFSNFGSKSRIISLPRASDVTFCSNFRPVTDRSLSSISGRERYSDMEEEKLHLRRNRFQDHSFGSSRGNVLRGTGRGSGRFDRLRRDWDSGRDFESCGVVADYRFRHKRTAAVGESENERNDYISRLDGAAFASNRRKPLNDTLPSFRHQPARRLSPNGRDDTAMMGIQMLRRAPRNISPSRCTGEDGSAYVALRHSEKFNRDFPADISDPVYSHQQSMYDGPDGHFVQGNTKFTAMQRRGFPRMRSKSPVRYRNWSSPRRRLTEGFNGHQDLSQHRSPVMYREDRRRSSPRTSFTEVVISPQRRDSPSYTARRLNDMRDVNSVQEHRHPRSLSSRRSPPDRVVTSTNRRVEILDHRERTDGNGYFDGPIHTGRFPELHSGENTNERRKYGERQGGPRKMRNVEEQEGGNFRQ
ncbi:uncharacterized protein LOC129870420 isoform X2 [Solanum dulcamara]|uniref:uncharacterized protein LOC129870420 isoform X2 n=1 Tax=Solanum dulcamara TaxID=45834 RepID=UPI0024859917|nr:uncharacterized protein LOC129870420 isoform X2 [Solanum dulcamara]